jgi:hypothetical protein
MRSKRIATLAASFAALALAGPASAFGAPEPVLQVSSTHLPVSKPVPAGSYAKYTLAVSNAGTAATSGSVNLDFAVPTGLEVTSVSVEDPVGLETWSCSVASDSLSASCEGPAVFGFFPLPMAPGKEACQDFTEEELGEFVPCHIFVTLRAEPDATPGAAHPTIEACGGGAAACASADDPIEIISPSFAITSLDGAALQENGDPATQAGSHPYSARTEFFVPTVVAPDGQEFPIEDIQDVSVKLPPGLLGNPQALDTCTEAQLFGENGFFQCPSQSQIGTVTIWFTKQGGLGGEQSVPLYNMQAAHGTPALLGFNFGNTLVQVYVKLRSGDDYGVTVISKNAPQAIPFEGATFGVWGIPADPSHDPERSCPGSSGSLPILGCQGGALKPFFTLPTSCVGEGEVPGAALRTFIDVNSWQGSEATSSFLSHDNAEPNPNPIGIDGCNSVDFSPALQARPTTNVADSPSGLDVDLKVPQHEECDAGPPVACENAEANLKDTTVTLPEGMSINPSGANGLGACSEAQFGFTSKEGDVIHTTPDAATCPDNAKLGTVQVDSPTVDHPLNGNVYIAAPHANPFNSLLAIYITLDDPQTGIVVKLAGEVHADPNTGQLTTTVLHNPQLPFEDFKLHFFGGAGGALRTPATCGTYSTTSVLTPWSAPDSGPPAEPTDPWAITQAPGGGACPTSAAAQPHNPSLDAGTISPIAGSYSPMVETDRREDGSQEFSVLTASPPPGMIGRLVGTTYCPEAAFLAAAKKSGREEEASPSCPASSRLGVIDVQAGAGPAPYNAQGILYLTGPYKGAPLSITIITPATAGPFDLGTVVVRTPIDIDPTTGQINAVSDPIPRLLQGIPLDVRSVGVHLDRPNFIRNPTNCNPLTFGGAVTSVLGQTAPLSNRFQVGECTSLSFKPKLGIRLIGGTKRGSHPALKGTVTMPEGGANIAKAVVALPHSEFLDQGHIGTVCTRVQFAEGDGNGSACPAASVYGHAVATSPLVDYPLEGNAYLRSSSNKLPDLVVALHGPPSQPVAVNVVGRIDSVKGGIRTSFEGIPDLPVSSFVLSMEGGRKGLLQNSTNICKGVHKATAEFDGQNGKAADLTPVLKNGKCGKAKKRNHRAQRAARG